SVLSAFIGFRIRQLDRRFAEAQERRKKRIEAVGDMADQLQDVPEMLSRLRARSGCLPSLSGATLVVAVASFVAASSPQPTPRVPIPHVDRAATAAPHTAAYPTAAPCACRHTLHHPAEGGGWLCPTSAQPWQPRRRTGRQPVVHGDPNQRDWPSHAVRRHGLLP